MRVAVRHTDEEHPNHAWFAAYVGRAQDTNHPLTGEAYSAEEVVEANLARARKEYPEKDGYEHRIEVLTVAGEDDDGNEVGEWVPLEDAEGLPRPGAGAVLEREVEAVATGRSSSGRKGR